MNLYEVELETKGVLTPRQVANALRDEAGSYRNQNLRVLLERAAELIEEQIEPEEGDMEEVLRRSIEKAEVCRS